MAQPVKQYIEDGAGYTRARSIALDISDLEVTLDTGDRFEQKAPCGCYVIDDERYPSLVGVCAQHRL